MEGSRCVEFAPEQTLTPSQKAVFLHCPQTPSHAGPSSFKAPTPHPPRASRRTLSRAVASPPPLLPPAVAAPLAESTSPTLNSPSLRWAVPRGDASCLLQERRNHAAPGEDTTLPGQSRGPERQRPPRPTQPEREDAWGTCNGDTRGDRAMPPDLLLGWCERRA